MVPSTITASRPSAFVGAVLQPEAVDHCEKHNLFGPLELAIQIAKEAFTLAGPIEVELEIDYDGDENRPLLNVPVAATVEETLRQYDAFSREWIERAPVESRLQIGLLPNIVERG